MHAQVIGQCLVFYTEKGLHSATEDVPICSSFLTFETLRLYASFLIKSGSGTLRGHTVLHNLLQQHNKLDLQLTRKSMDTCC